MEFILCQPKEADELRQQYLLGFFSVNLKKAAALAKGHEGQQGACSWCKGVGILRFRIS